MKWESAPKGAPVIGWAADRAQDTPSAAEVEAIQRVHAVRVVLAAVEDGTWPLEVEVLDALGQLLDVASRFALVAELEQAA